MYTAIITLVYGTVETLHATTYDVLMDILWTYTSIFEDVAILHDGRVLSEEEVLAHLQACWDIFMPEALEESEA